MENGIKPSHGIYETLMKAQLDYKAHRMYLK